MSEPWKAYVAGAWRQTAETREIRSPWDGAVVGTVCQAGPAELEAAIAGAAAALPATRALSAYERARICLDVARTLAARREELGQLMCREGAKPISDARAEVDRAVHSFELAAGEAERLGGEMIPLDLRPASAGRFGVTRRVPVGPVAAISPFNFPLNLAVHKVAPAIAAGCPVVLKPAPQTPIVCLELARAIEATAWPRAAFSVVPSSPEVADVLVTDERLKLLTFTGSPGVGWELKRRSGKKKVVLELGANSAVIVDAGADLGWAVPRIVYGAYSYAGQKCISVQRVFAHRSIHDAFVDRLIAESRKVKVGDPADPDVLVGPLIDEAAARRVEAWIEEARAGGAQILVGGPRQGAVIPPTVIAKAPRGAKVSCAEVFGPVVTVDPFDRWEDALAAVNDSEFGLQAGLFTESLDHALAAFADLEVGGVILNDIPTYRIDHMPYGGVKDSGFGREAEAVRND